MDVRNKKKVICVAILLLASIMLYLIIQSFGYIENYEVLVPTGNVDIFEINCVCCKKSAKNKDNEHSGGSGTSSTDKVDNVNNTDNADDSKNPEDETGDDDDEPLEPDYDEYDFVVYDKYKVWDNEELRIFANPAYEYTQKIAPGSSNSYAFVVRNNNDFDAMVNIEFDETNDNNINMLYKLKTGGNYILGSVDKYETIKGKTITGIEIPAKSQKAYILDWKWVDSDNDTMIGFDASAQYKLAITIEAEEKL